MHTARSINKILIRLTGERWEHIVESHDDLQAKRSSVLKTISEPDIIVQGIQNELLAAKKIRSKWLIVVYKEVTKTDGFIITAFSTSRMHYVLKKEIIWKKQ